MSLVALSGTTLCAQQSLSDFYNNTGKELLAQCAHPTNTYKSATVEFYDGYADVDILYEDGWETELNVYNNDLLFYKIVVVKNTDFVDAFWFLQKIVEEVRKHQDNQNYQKTQSDLEAALNRVIDDWNGRDWSLFLLNVLYRSN